VPSEEREREPSSEFPIREPWRLLTEAVHRRRLVGIFAIFVVFGLLGTPAHELGHYAVAGAFGQSAHLSYGWVIWDGDPADQALLQRGSAWEREHPERAFPEAAPLAAARDRGARQDLWISAGGPLQNALCGSVGLLWLLLLGVEGRRTWRGWLATLTALFWSREPFVLVVGALGAAGGNPPLQEDELRIALSLGWPTWSVLIPAGLVGFAVCVAVIALQPKKRRWHVLGAGPLGCLVGVVIWYAWLGPLLLPLPS
tara:strand:- start:2316 stop:3083 length:768 start_codon:yes stop_codon:yes gene_type:complete